MRIENFLYEIRINESTSDFLTIQQNIVDMFKHNNARNIVIKLFDNYKNFVELVKGNDREEVPDKKKEEKPKPFDKKKEEELPPEETATGKVMKSVVKKEEPKKEEKDKKPNLEGAVASLLKRITGENIQLDLDRYYTTSGKKKSDILSDTKLINTIADVKTASISDEKRLLMPLFQVNIKLDEYLSNKRHELSMTEKQKIVLAVFWILLIEGKYIPSDEKLNDLVKKYGQTKSFKVVQSRRKKEKKKEAEDKEKIEEVYAKNWDVYKRPMKEKCNLCGTQFFPKEKNMVMINKKQQFRCDKCLKVGKGLDKPLEEE